MVTCPGTPWSLSFSDKTNTASVILCSLKLIPLSRHLQYSFSLPEAFLTYKITFSTNKNADVMLACDSL